MTRNHAGLSPASVETVAGLSAGAVATLVVHPLDLVKTRMQIHRSSAATSQSLTTLSVLRALARTPQPLASLYRGLTPNLVGNASSWASFFFFKARAERAILGLKNSRRRRKSLSSSSSSSSGSESSATQLTPADYFLASAAAGVGVQVLTNPVWVLKTRMVSSDRGAAGAYPGMLAGARALLRAEGWRGFYRGLGISLFGVSHGAVQFAVYDPLKRAYLARRRRRHGENGNGSNNSSGSGNGAMANEATLVISSLSKLVAGAATYPYQVIRSRLQNYDAEARFGRGIRGVARRTWAEEGARGFYRGIVPGVVRVMPATWVTFLVYENTRSYLLAAPAGGGGGGGGGDDDADAEDAA
ncbi:mitochondrial carrier domain-containing protein [Xylariaceae sp. FL0804]|nr:mitochondrial carrier domain-containing protein [Xylariaceae sp. FL0804]